MKAEVPVQEKDWCSSPRMGEMKQTWIKVWHLPAGAVGRSLRLAFAMHGPETPDAERGYISKVCGGVSFNLVSNRLLFKACSLH